MSKPLSGGAQVPSAGLVVKPGIPDLWTPQLFCCSQIEKISLLTSSCVLLPSCTPTSSCSAWHPAELRAHFPAGLLTWRMCFWLTDPAWPTCIVPCVSPQTTYFPDSPSELLLDSASETAWTTPTHWVLLTRAIFPCTPWAPLSPSSAFPAQPQALAYKPAPTPLLVHPYQLLHMALGCLAVL